jgi:hypothetical protein
MAFPAAPTESGSAKIHFLTTTGNAAAGWAAIDTATSDTGSNTLGFAAIATHVEGDAVGAPGGIDTTSVPCVLVAGDDGTNAVPLQLSGSDLKITLDSEAVVLGTGSAAIGKLAANSGVDIGDVDVLSLPSLAAGTNAIGKLAANSGVDIGDVTLTAGTAAIGKLAANSGVDIGDVDVTSLPAGNIGQQAMAASLSTVPASNIGDATYIGDIKFGESLPAGTAAIGKLAANSGVDIGDVDVTSVAGTVTVANGGTFVVQEDGAALTALQLIDDAVYVDDANWINNTSKHLLVGGVYESSPQTITDGDVGPLEVDTNGYLKVSLEANPVGVGGGTAYTEDVASANPIVGTASMMERDDQLGAVTPVEGDWLGMRGTSKGALWVALADASGDPITSFGGGTEYTEDVATANPQVGKAIMVERDDALTTVSPVEGDWIGLRGTAEGALWTQDFNSDAMLTALQLLDNAIAGNEMQVDVVASLPAGTNAIGKLAANSGVDIGDVTLTAGTAAIGKLAANSGVDIGDVDVLSLPSLPAGTNAIGKLAANSGVDIGDVDVLSLPALATGSNAIGKLAANSGVDIGDVDVTSLPAGNLGQQAMAASLSTVPASNITDATYIGDIKFGEALPAGTAAIGKLAANSGVDIGDVDVLSLPALAAGTNAIGKLAANSGVDIGDVDVTSVPAPLNVTGGGPEAAASRTAGHGSQ